MKTCTDLSLNEVICIIINLVSSSKFWTLFTHPLRGLSSRGSFTRTCGFINLKGAPSFRRLILVVFKQIKNNIVYKIYIYLQFTINFEKKANAPHQDLLILRIISRSSFLFNYREHEIEIHIDLKRLIYHQTTKHS